MIKSWKDLCEFLLMYCGEDFVVRCISKSRVWLISFNDRDWFMISRSLGKKVCKMFGVKKEEEEKK